MEVCILFTYHSMKHLFLLLSLCCILPPSNASNARLYLVAETDMTVTIYDEIDNGYNNYIEQMEVSLQAGKSHTIITGMSVGSDWKMLHCNFSNGEKCELLLFPQDEVTVYVNQKGVRFEGDNATGLQYFYDHFTSVGHRVKYLGTIDKYFLEYVQQQRGIHTIVPEINRIVITPQMNKQDSLLQAQEITPLFYEKLHKNTETLLNGYIAERMVSLLKRPRYREVALKDSVAIMHITDSIYQKHPLTDLDLIKFNYYLLYIPQYLSFYYGKQHPDLHGYDAKAFGPYITYLNAPQPFQSVLLGGACMFQLKRGGKEMDMPVVKRFFNEQFLDSPYAYFLNEQVKDEPQPDDEIFADAHFISEPIESLSDLCKLSALQGKYLYIDLWASWCMPCRGEFSHKEKAEEILSAHGNIATVYVSIDKEEQEKAWRNCINRYKLKGYHLRASAALTDWIQKEVYQSAPFEIPRYVLLSPSGEILNNDLPRPSSYPQLKEAMENTLSNR